MNKTLRKILIASMMMFSFATWAELPSWGMTENQYKMPNFSNKMADIGAQAYKNNWLLKVTAPSDWHSTIRNALTKTGERDVQVTFKDSLYQSISITAVPGAKVAKISSSSNGNTTVQKQVIIDKPEIDTAVEAPDFGDTDMQINGNELLEGIGELAITVPEANTTASAEPARQPAAAQPEPVTQPAAQPVQQPAEQAPSQPTAVASQSAPAAVDESIEKNKEDLRKRHARTKRVNKELSYSSINSKDELFIKGSVVLIKRFINQGVVLFYWMKEPYDPNVHKLVEKGSGKFQKDPEAIAGDVPAASKKAQVADKPVEPTNLDFVAVDTAIEDQDDLRSSHIRNKRVDSKISASQLKEDDVLYVQNQTVLVERPLTSSRSTYFWLVGETTITREVERKGDNKFIIK